MFIAALFSVAKRWKQPTSSSIDGWINRMWFIHILEWDSPSERKEILTQATIWMNFEDIVLSEISQSRKDTYRMILLWEVPMGGKLIETKGRRVGTRGWWEYSFSWGRWEVLEMGGGDGYTMMWMYFMLLSCRLNNGEDGGTFDVNVYRSTILKSHDRV